MTSREIVLELIRTKNENKTYIVPFEEVAKLYIGSGKEQMSSNKVLDDLKQLEAGNMLIKRSMNNIFKALKQKEGNEESALTVLKESGITLSMILDSLTITEEYKDIKKVFSIEDLNAANVPLLDLKQKYNFSLIEIRNSNLFNDMNQLREAGYNDLNDYIEYNSQHQAQQQKGRKFTLLELLQAGFGVLDLYNKAGFKDSKEYITIVDNNPGIINLLAVSTLFPAHEMVLEAKTIQQWKDAGVGIEWFIPKADDNHEHDLAYTPAQVFKVYGDKVNEAILTPNLKKGNWFTSVRDWFNN